MALQGWQDLTYLAQMGKSGPEAETASACSRLALSLQEDLSAWQTWSAHPQPEAQALPAGFQDQLTSMRKLLVTSQPLASDSHEHHGSTCIGPTSL